MSQMIDQFALRYLNKNVTVAVVILAVLLVRVFMRKLPRRYVYCLWAIVGVRMLFSFQIPSALSVFGLLPQGEWFVAEADTGNFTGTMGEGELLPDAGETDAGQKLDAGLVANAGQQANGQGVPSGNMQSATPNDAGWKEQENVAVPNGAGQGKQEDLAALDGAGGDREGASSGQHGRDGGFAPQAEGKDETRRPGGTNAFPGKRNGTGRAILEILACTWAIGAAVILGSGIRSCLRLKRHAWDAVLLQDGVWETDRIPAPFVMGIFRPRIYVPSRLEPLRLECVLAHERCHVKRRDPQVKFLAYLLLAYYWMNPLAWLAYRCFVRDQEMSCDESVLLTLGEEVKKAYGLALLSFATEHGPIGFSPLAFGETDVSRRIKHMLGFRRPSRWTISLSLAIVILASATCLSGAYGRADSDGTNTWKLSEEMSEEKAETELGETEALGKAQGLWDPEKSDTASLSSEKPPEDRDLYQEMIDKARECLITEGASWQGEELELSVVFFHGIQTYETLGYLIQDLNGDGIDELIFGENATKETSDWDGIVYDVYTIRDGKLIQVLNGWEKYLFRLCENGVLMNDRDGGAFAHTRCYYAYDGMALNLIEAVRLETDPLGNTYYYHSTTDPYDLNARTLISGQEATEIQGKYVYVAPVFTPFCERPKFKQVTMDIPEVGEITGVGEEVQPFKLSEISQRENEGSNVEGWLEKERIHKSGQVNWFYNHFNWYTYDGEKWLIKDKNANPRYEIRPPAGGMKSGWNNVCLEDGILYAGMAYDPSVQNGGYLFAYDLEKEAYVWKSPESTYNNECFLVSEGIIFCGYGTDEGTDYLYQIDQRTGKVLERMEVQGNPDFLVEKDGNLYVHTESHDYVFEKKR